MRCVDLAKDVKRPTSVQHWEVSGDFYFLFFYRRATWSVGRPGAAFSTPMSVALRRRFPRRRPPCPCCKFTSSTAIPTELAINAWWISLYVPPRHPPRYCQTLRHRNQTVFKHRLSAGTRVVGAPPSFRMAPRGPRGRGRQMYARAQKGTPLAGFQPFPPDS